jgi:hypothetical protein
LCERVIRAGWAANKEAAQAGSDFLDYVNASMEDFDASPAVMGVPVASPLPQQALPKAALKLPRDTFLLSIDQVRECLTLNIDSSILLRSQQGAGHQQSSRRGGWPLGKKRKVNGVGFVAHGEQTAARWHIAKALLTLLHLRMPLLCYHGSLGTLSCLRINSLLPSTSRQASPCCSSAQGWQALQPMDA